MSTWMRFRDDFRVVFAGKVNKVRLEEIREGLEKMCGSGLEIELEGFGYEKMEFLDMNVFVRNGVFVISDNNKNVNLWDEKKEKSEWRCRFPILTNTTPRRQGVATVMGMFSRIIRNCGGCREICLMSLLQCVVEFSERGYGDNLLLRACYGVSYLYGELMRKELRDVKMRSRGRFSLLSDECIEET